jgi:anaerobic magnesium-protoporphyrin IX monomethyl ester cyclase
MPTDDLRVVFVHTPMATIRVEERRHFWQTFDQRYHAAHPKLRHMRRNLWELPHWMTWLGGVLVDKGYSHLSVLDFYSTECALAGIDRARVEQSLRSAPADVYLFSPMTPNVSFAFDIAGLIKSLYPDSIIIFGGVIATPLRIEVAAHPNVDIVVYDRGEYALPSLLDALRGVGDINDVGNICHCDPQGGVIDNGLTYPWMPLDTIPFPKVDLFPSDVGLDLRYLRQVYGLGCPYKCEMCTIQTIGRKAAYFRIERVLAEIDAYRSHYGAYHNIYFGDETFTAHTERTKALCSALKEHGEIAYDCQTRLNLLNDHDMLAGMHESGCRWVEIGVESVNQSTQDLFKQRVKLTSLVETLKRVRDAGLPACSFLINGFPNQTCDDMRRSIDAVADLIAKKLLQATYLFGLVPYPGSDIYNRPGAYGMNIHERDFRYYHEDMLPVYSTTYATSDAIYEVFLYGLSVLGQAMDASPYFGKLPTDKDDAQFGTFWQDAHV